MSTLVRFTPKSVTTEQYDQVMRKLEDSGDWLPDGLDYHVAFGSRGDADRDSQHREALDRTGGRCSGRPLSLFCD
jgi:hypothetical protein